MRRLKIADKYLQSWIGWVYKPFYAITGPGESIIDSTSGEIRPIYTELFSRTYAHAVAGKTVSMEFDDAIKVTTLVYEPIVTATKGTEIRLMKRVHYPGGFEVTVSPGGSVVIDDEIENLIQIIAVGDKDVDGDMVKVMVKPKEAEKNMSLIFGGILGGESE